MWGLAFQPATRVRSRGESVGRLGIQSSHASFIVGDRVEVNLRIRKRTDQRAKGVYHQTLRSLEKRH